MNDFARYLLAKRTVDDRALDRRVWERLRREAREAGAPLRIADIGAGIATFAERMAEWRILESLSDLRYTAVEPREELAAEARRRLEPLPFPWAVERATLEEFSRDHGASVDLVVAHAFLDVVPLAPALAALVEIVRPGGLLYLPITFDGETVFEPSSPGDALVLSAYHQTMEANGSSRTGRKLFHALPEHGAEILEIGSSDWIVHPSGGRYPSDEEFFLEFLLHTIEGAVRARVSETVLDPWLAERRHQLAEAELFYCAHQLDVLARKSP
jgi:SAM-dependent methyltransferase